MEACPLGLSVDIISARELIVKLGALTPHIINDTIIINTSTGNYKILIPVCRYAATLNSSD